MNKQYKQDYILLIMNCKKHDNKAAYQKSTWLSTLPDYLLYYHVIGEPELESPFAFDNENHILWIKVEDDYNSLPKKVIRAYHAVNEIFDYQYIFKTDDDQMLTNDKFFTVIKGMTSSITNKLHYGGFIVDVKQNHLSQYHKIHPELPANLPVYKTKYCNGRFYFLSKQAIIHLISNQQMIEQEYFEDYAIGYHLNSCYKENMVHLATDKFFKDF